MLIGCRQFSIEQIMSHVLLNVTRENNIFLTSPIAGKSLCEGFAAGVTSTLKGLNYL